MPTRRALLRGGGAAALAVLAGCQTAFDDRTNETATSSGAGEYRLDAERVAPDRVADGATVGAATPGLHGAVADATTADGRVDLAADGSADRDETPALAEFEYVEFRGETYEPTASFAGFAGEAGYRYEAVAVESSEVGEDDDVLAYADLSDDERAVADGLLDSGAYSVGHHEEKPDAVRAFDRVDYLRADGETYRIQVAVGDHGAHHMLTLDPADPGDDARVVTVLDDPPEADWSDVVQEGLGPGSVGIDDAPADEALVEYLRRVDYVATATSVLDVSVTETVQ